MKNPRVSRRKAIIKTRPETMKKKQTRLQQKSAKLNKVWFFEKLNKIDKPQPDSSRKQREESNDKIRNENGEITTDKTKIQRIIRDYYQQLYDNKMDNLEEMDKFLGKYNLPKLKQDEIENLHRQVTSTEIETVIKKSSNKQKPRTIWLHR